MRSSFSLHGVIVPLITPMDEHNQIDHDAVRQVADFVVSKGVHAVMVGGTTGEGMLLDPDERKALLETILAQVNRRVPVIAHTGCIDTATTVRLSQHARAAGANVISVVTPYFYSLNDEQLYRHYITVAEAVADTPMLLYTIPGNAKNDISPALLERLLDRAPNIVGIKSSNDDLVRFQDYVKVGGADFTACFGVDELMLGGLAFGSKAQISGNANSFPEPFIQLYDAFQAGDLPRAQQLQQVIHAIVSLHHAGQTTAFFKATLKMRGVSTGRVRPPMRELTAEELEEVSRGVMQMKLI